MKYKYTAIIKPTYKLDVTDWNDENESKDKMAKRLKSELADISVFSRAPSPKALKTSVDEDADSLKNS